MDGITITTIIQWSHFILILQNLVCCIETTETITAANQTRLSRLQLSDEDLASSVVVNQLAILDMMQNLSNSSCETLRESKESCPETASLERNIINHIETKLTSLEGNLISRTEQLERKQTEIFETMSNTVKWMMNITNRLQSMMKQVPYDASEVTSDADMDETEGRLVHNDTLPSLCSGNKFLLGKVGSLELVKSGSYSPNTECSWNITIPKSSYVTLTWSYISTEDHSACSYDWVEVLDITKDEWNPYGRRLCGTLDSKTLDQLKIRLRSTTNLLVRFKSDGSNEVRGFKIYYEAH